MSTNILICILIIFTIIIIWLFSSVELKDTFSTEEIILQKSAGIYDRPAQEVLKRSRQKKNKKPKDKATIAKVIVDNIFGGDISLKRDDINLTKEAAINYNEAIREIDIIDNNFNNIMTEADNFRRRLGNLLFDDLPEVIILNGQPRDEFFMILTELNDNIGTKQEIHTTQIRNEAKKEAASLNQPADIVIDKFVKNMQTHTNDSQNSHDSFVNKEINKTLYIIENDPNQPPTQSIHDTIIDIKNRIRESDVSDSKKNQAYNALDVIIAKNQEMSTYGNKKELDIINLIWARSDHPNNSENSNNIKDSIIDSLIDINERNGWGENPTVCANGRMSRIVNSLASLDYNEYAGKIQTKEQIKNYVLQQSAILWKNYLDECIMAGGDLQHIAEAYKTPQGPDDNDPALQIFKEKLKICANKMLDENEISAELNPDIINDVYIGLDFELKK